MDPIDEAWPDVNSREKQQLLVVFVAMGLSVVAHSLILVLMPWEEEQVTGSPPSIRIDLRFDALLPVAKEAVEIEPDRVRNDVVPDVPDSQPAAIHPTGRELYEQTLQHARQLGARDEQSKSPITFSTKDFPTNNEPPSDTGVAVDLRVRAVSNLAGISTAVVRGLFGGQFCLQQRGDLNDPDSWRWHRVPIALCGHLSGD